MHTLPEFSRTVFREYAEDADNWNGTPLVGGNVGDTSPAHKGALMHLKKLGLIVTISESDDTGNDNVWLIFTPAGRAYAQSEFGIEIQK